MKINRRKVITSTLISVLVFGVLYPFTNPFFSWHLIHKEKIEYAGVQLEIPKGSCVMPFFSYKESDHIYVTEKDEAFHITINNYENSNKKLPDIYKAQAIIEQQLNLPFGSQFAMRLQDLEVYGFISKRFDSSFVIYFQDVSATISFLIKGNADAINKLDGIFETKNVFRKIYEL